MADDLQGLRECGTQWLARDDGSTETRNGGIRGILGAHDPNGLPTDAAAEGPAAGRGDHDRPGRVDPSHPECRMQDT